MVQRWRKRALLRNRERKLTLQEQLTVERLLFRARMWFVSLRTELWTWLLFSLLHLWGRLSASTPRPTLSVPTLDLYSRSMDSAVLVCQAPEGHRGVQFILYREREKVDSWEQPLGAEEARFTVRLKDSSQHELFCCLYKTEQGSYSTFSPYLQLDRQRVADPTRPIPPDPDPPTLSMQPSNGLVKHGDTLLFHCSLPPPLPQYHVNSLQRPVAFMLLKPPTADSKEVTSVVPKSQSGHLTHQEPQPGVFNVGPVTVAEQGRYTCLYQINRGGGLQNSSVSNMVQVTVMDPLPTPTLVVQKQSDVWHLVCKGSPAYPGALFSLYLVGHLHPVTTHQAKVAQHQAVFSVPVQDTPDALYQCEYSVLLRNEWSNSERSLAVSVSQGGRPALTRDSTGVDWPLVLGSVSAVLLFLCSVALVVVVIQRKVKAAAKAKKKRVEAKFWTRVHRKDHIVDVTLQRSSFTSQDWTSGHTESASRSQLWNPLSTFTTPFVPN